MYKNVHKLAYAYYNLNFAPIIVCDYNLSLVFSLTAQQQFSPNEPLPGFKTLIIKAEIMTA